MVPSSISKRSTSLSNCPKILAKLTATDVTPCSRLDPVRLCEIRFPSYFAISAVIREVVVLPLLPVITIFFALLAPMTDCNTFGSIRRAIIPGRLVPPPMRSRRPDAPANFPAEIARERRALPKGVMVFLLDDRGVREVALLLSDFSVVLLLLFTFSFSIKPHKLSSCQYGMQYNKT